MSNKDKLFAPRIEIGTVEVPGVGVVKVRGLSRWEMLTAGKLSDKGPLYMERAMLAYAFVGLDDEEYRLTEDDVAQWQRNSPATELQSVIYKVNELSGVARGSAKEQYKSDGDDPIAGV